MIRLLSKIPLFWSFYSAGWPRVLPASYAFSLTFRCNSRCWTCHIWRKKKVPELTREEWRKVFHSLGKSCYFVTFSGGEPFLREDFTEIAGDLYEISQPEIMVIPTNGLSTDRIQKETRRILQSCPKSHLTINLSLDGVGKSHDKIRGVEGNFKKAIATFNELRTIRNKNFSLGVHTVISQANVADFPALCDFVLDELRPDSYIAEIAENRKELGTMNKNITPDLSAYRKAVDYLRKKTKEQSLGRFSKIKQAFRSSYYDLVWQTLERKTQVIPCYAGVSSCQIAPNGDVWECCVRADVLGNLKKENFDFSKIWFSQKAAKLRKSVKNKECYCPLANVYYTNTLMSPSALGKVLWELIK